eukprot:2703805-Rhodomonas_salina.1
MSRYPKCCDASYERSWQHRTKSARRSRSARYQNVSSTSARRGNCTATAAENETEKARVRSHQAVLDALDGHMLVV